MQKHNLRIGVDIMGSKRSLDSFLPDLIDLLRLEETLPELHLFCTDEVGEVSAPFPLSMHISETFVGMEDHPLHSLRRKKNASMYKGLEALATGSIDALVSCGNTGALVAGAYHFLPKDPKCQRPALLTLLPTEGSPVAVLDVGASIEWEAETLLSYAKLGRAYQQAMGVTDPTVGLLNIGTEETKGNKKLIETHTLFEQEKDAINFAGNIEGRDVFKGHVDVLVTDGFTGNVLLKTAEGVSAFLLKRVHNELPKEPISEDVLETLEKDTNYAEYPGAVLVGLEKPVIKCHGDFNPLAIKNGILGATKLVKSAYFR